MNCKKNLTHFMLPLSYKLINYCSDIVHLCQHSCSLLFLAWITELFVSAFFSSYQVPEMRRKIISSAEASRIRQCPESKNLSFYESFLSVSLMLRQGKERSELGYRLVKKLIPKIHIPLDIPFPLFQGKQVRD